MVSGQQAGGRKFQAPTTKLQGSSKAQKSQRQVVGFVLANRLLASHINHHASLQRQLAGCGEEVLVIGPDFGQRIAAELLEECPGDLEGDHVFHYDAGG